MAKVLGVGGVFFKTPDVAATKAWYLRVLGIESGDWGGFFAPLPKGGTAWNPFKADSDSFAPSQAAFMINYAVDDMEGVLAKVRSEGVEVLKEETMDGIGRFAWIMDPNGLKIELWEPEEESADTPEALDVSQA